MRLGVLADVHGNQHALDASLALLTTQRVDAYIWAGDIVGYGPSPNECVARVASLAGPRVAGNHDLMAVGMLPVDGAGWLARDSLSWTQEQLTSTSRDVLRGLPLTDAFGEVVVAHGTLDDPRRYVRTGAEATAQVAQLSSRFPEARYLILGHTHIPRAFGERRGEILNDRAGSVSLEPDERYLLNPGSVGQSRQRRPDARIMVLDLERRQATFHAVPFDVAACRAALQQAGRPAWSCHLSPSLLARVRRRAARGLSP